MGPLLHLSTVFHGAEWRANPDRLPSHPRAMPSQTLTDAYSALLSNAPAPLFARARRLYLNKYCLDGRGTKSVLRLFVAQETIEEREEADFRARWPEQRVDAPERRAAPQPLTTPHLHPLQMFEQKSDKKLSHVSLGNFYVKRFLPLLR
mgnify:CR=1 FL=1